MAYYSVLMCIMIFGSALLSMAHAQNCNSTASILVYHAQPSPFRGEFTLSDHPLRNSHCFVSASGLLVCGPQIILGDGDTDMEPAQPNLDDQNNLLNEINDFLIWSRSSAHPYVSIQRSEGPPITAFKLNFLNYPAQNVSLPNIQLLRTNIIEDTSGDNVDFVLLGNEELSHDDYERTSVTLYLLTPVTFRNVLLRWSFEEVYNLEWFFLSEVTFCTDTQPPYSASTETIQFLSSEANEVIQPSAQDLASGVIVFTCTVSNQGSFSWLWKQNDTVINSDTKFQTFTADGTRTSKLIISQLNFMDGATYTCDVSHQSSPSNRTSRQYQVIFPVFVETQEQVNGYLGEQAVLLTCEVHGYLRGPPSLSWFTDSGPELVSNNKYTIECRPGSKQVWFENGTTGMSTISVLTIKELNETDKGSYSCRGEGQESTTMLVVVEGTAPPTTAPPTTAPETTITNTTDERNQELIHVKEKERMKLFMK